MSATARKLLDDALRLPAEERAHMAAELLASLDGDADPDADEAWADEIHRRLDRVAAGEERFVDWDVVREDLRRTRK